MYNTASPNVAGNMPHSGIFTAVPISAQTAWCDAVISNLPRVAINHSGGRWMWTSSMKSRLIRKSMHNPGGIDMDMP
jgi:hypothetical protein